MHASGSIAQGVISWSGFGVVRFRLVFQPTNRLWRDKKLPAVPFQGLTQSVVRQSGSEVTLLPRSWTRYFQDAEAMFAIFAWQGRQELPREARAAIKQTAGTRVSTKTLVPGLFC